MTFAEIARRERNRALAQARRDVKRGAAALDRLMPTWFKKIDLKTLDLASCEYCIAGQLADHSRSRICQSDNRSGFNRFSRYIEKKFGQYQRNGEATVYAFGFDASGVQYADLDRMWNREIRRRFRQAEEATT